jgi:peptidoglycan/LPS O-acetylase OafA/YrhL
MSRGLSIYLDLLRFLAAIEVMLFHWSGRPALGGHLATWSAFGHEAVVIFFVLSGFVIRHTAEKRDTKFEIFATSRLTRIYSVALPALLLTYLFDRIGIWLAPQVYNGLITNRSGLLRLLIGALFLNESWNQSVQMLSNTPYWSIAYEFWYYFIFAGLFFFRERRRLALVALVCLISGYKILLLFPIWMMGWLAYVFTKRDKSLPLLLSLALFLQPIAVLWAYEKFSLQQTSDVLISLLGYDGWRTGLSWSRYIISDTLLGGSLALHFIGAHSLGRPLESVLYRFERTIRFAAGQSFTLYLLHQPTMLFIGAILYDINLGGARAWVVLASTIFIVLVVAHFTEGQKHRLRPFFEKVIASVANWMPGIISLKWISRA